ncbi:portal protein [Microbacterium phage NoodlelyBoi]|uniref:Portal protein n=1 Tax=Microbacterium phage NoodlelyBoi TaxID=2813165 RepID=A0A899IRS9_9CAUD|nr:portal protein [Microbacterium phage NoodlelyBoi]QSM01214.1 portal protein [Microbacterium phage NoodlelyBoi]
MAVMSAPRVYIPIPGGPSPSDLPDHGAIIPAQPEPVTAPRPAPMNSLVAAATRLTNETLGRGRGRRASAEGWQEDAWEMYDLVGELRFITNLLANQQSKARFYVGTIAENPDDPPVPVDDVILQQGLEAIGDGPSGLSQLIQRLAVNLQIPGDAWLVGIPKDLMPDADETTVVTRDIDGNVRLDDLVWHALSVTEVKFPSKDEVEVTMGDDANADTIKATPDDLWLIRVWKPHPRRFWQADSATRSALPVLRELVGLTMHISAQIDSRLAGAGVLIVPDSASQAAKRNANLPIEGEEDPFTASLIKAMMTPISDRSNASAYVPLVWTVPDEAADKFDFLNFAKPLDAEAKSMRDESIRRYALSADAPPELLLGMGGMNHWGQWLAQEDTVRAHIEPPLALICDALTTQYIRVLMREIGTYSDDVIENTVVWYEVEHLIIRPNRGQDARDAHAAGVISDAALRDALGFTEDDAPPMGLDPAVSLAFDLVRAKPDLMMDPGLEDVIAQIRAAIGNPTGDDAGVTEPLDPNAEGEVTGELPQEAPASPGFSLADRGIPAIQFIEREYAK